jgi:SOS-response transcriptional repressor LexA
MEAEFNEGDIIFINPTAKTGHVDYVVSKNDGDEASFKQYKRFHNTRILHPLNTKYLDIVLNKDLEYRIVGVVMENKMVQLVCQVKPLLQVAQEDLRA